jgi:MFS family permease
MTDDASTALDRVVAWGSAKGQRLDERLPRSRFGRFGFTHAVAQGSDALVSLALAGSLFFDLQPDAAKAKVLQYLLISLAPFVVVAPFIGPLVDRLGHRRRWVLFITALIKSVVCLIAANHLTSLWLFPEAFALLVAGKAAAVARSSLVPEVVRNDDELVRANSRLSLIGVFGGAVAVIPGLGVREFIGNQWVLGLASIGFLCAAASSLRIRLKVHPGDSADGTNQLRRERANTYSDSVRVSGFVMALLRTAVGFIMFMSLFTLRPFPLWWTAVTLGALSSGSTFGAAIADKLRQRLGESRIILGGTIAVAAVAAFAMLFGTRWSGAVVAGVLGVAASASRLAFDSIIQRDQPQSGRGAAFARFETRFQLAWVLGALVATGLEPTRKVAFLFVAVMLSGATAVGFVGVPALEWLAGLHRRMVTPFRKKARREPGSRVSIASSNGTAKLDPDSKEPADPPNPPAPPQSPKAWRLPVTSTSPRKKGRR